MAFPRAQADGTVSTAGTAEISRVQRSDVCQGDNDKPARMADVLNVSVLVPVYNEAENLPLLIPKLLHVLRGLEARFEIIAVDDGSRDGSVEVLRSLAKANPELKVVVFRRNYGQTAAMMAGIDHASGSVIVPIDADLQNDPEDIPALLTTIAEGYDVVSGWRKERKDATWSRVIPSRIANFVISRISGVTLNDYGCTLKAYRSEVLLGMRLYGEMHRFIPIYASWMGAKVTEQPVRHNPRRFGRSKYGLGRTIKVLLDLVVVKFFDRFLVNPIYLFGGFGFFSLALSVLCFSVVLYLKWVEGISMISTPLPLVTVMTFLVGVSSILMGLLAEMVVRTYFESQHRSAYQVRHTINLANEK